MRPTEQILGCEQAHARLIEHVKGWSDEDVRCESLLPGWSIGHLLTHLARNADSVARRVDAATRNVLIDQYVGGAAGRAAEVEAGAHRSVAEITEDLVAASKAVDAAFAEFDDAWWDRPTRHGSGAILAVSELPFRRWREVETHMVDLGRGYSPSDWPAELVKAWLPTQLARLGDRTDPAALLAWTLRRGGPPPLEPY